jgi:hypothetical protein
MRNHGYRLDHYLAIGIGYLVVVCDSLANEMKSIIRSCSKVLHAPTAGQIFAPCSVTTWRGGPGHFKPHCACPRIKVKFDSVISSGQVEVIDVLNCLLWY